ncbi:MAG: hypothetical protein RQ936_02290 [Gammaproteobacteria bacterium]|nr:hypothetical protein [Gammaproteobacteria bacterium]
MKKHDITSDIIRLHEEDIMQELEKEVKIELSKEIPNELQNELNNLLARVKTPKKPTKADVVVLETLKNQNSKNVENFESVELLAAAGQSLGEWFSTPIGFSNEGFVVEIWKVIGMKDEIDIYLSPIQNKIEKVKRGLINYAGHNIDIIISNKGITILMASLYVDEKGASAEGSGRLLNMNEYQNIKGKLNMSIITKK